MKIDLSKIKQERTVNYPHIDWSPFDYDPADGAYYIHMSETCFLRIDEGVKEETIQEAMRILDEKRYKNQNIE